MNKILIIEDSVEVGELLLELLEINGYETSLLLNSEKIAAFLEKSIPDLIICDVIMPSMSGYQIIQFLNQNNKYKDIPLIFISARVEEQEIQKGLSYGARAYIKKPYKSRELLTKVSEILGEK